MKSLLARIALILGLAFAGAAQAQPTVTTPPASCSWCDIAVTWNGIVSPIGTDWIALAVPGSANTSFLASRTTTGAASGTVPLSIPGSVPFGTYVIRLFAGGSNTLLATSASFQVWPTVGGQVTASGSPLLGVTFAATNGASCGPSESWGYGCLVPYGWSGTITPSKPGHIFSPASRSHSNITNHTSASFTTAPAHTVSGTITAGGSALSGVAMATSSGQASCTSTNASGQYTCAIAPGWTGTVTPSLTDHVFTPASRSYTNVTGSHSAQTYTAQAFYQLSGTVTLNGSPLAGVALAATNGVACSSSNASGQYSCTVPSGWSGSVTPALGIYNFTPASRSYSSVTTHQTTQGYATATYQVSGTVTVGGSPVAGATINATNGVTCSPTNASGQYSCTAHSGWSGSVTPLLSGYVFTPASRSYTSTAGNATAEDYSSSVISGPSQVFFIHADHLDTPRLVANAVGTAVWRWDQQEPFGVNVPDENPSSLGAFEFPLRFPGQYFDQETNLHYNNFRDYDPSAGRYIQSDPIGLRGGINIYTYALLSPLRFVDLDGLAPGDKFKSADDAIVDAGRYARRQPTKDIEYGGWVYPVGDCWTYNFVRGNRDSVPGPRLHDARPKGATGVWHTHPDQGASSDNIFSPGDINFAHRYNIPIYVNTPSGDDKVYDPETRTERIISTIVKPKQPELCCDK
jgi:RHS repeat-associated protein